VVRGFSKYTRITISKSSCSASAGFELGVVHGLRVVMDGTRLTTTTGHRRRAARMKNRSAAGDQRCAVSRGRSHSSGWRRRDQRTHRAVRRSSMRVVSWVES
jgi:hypothetical protein